jgi:hypothetical protein
MYLPWGDISSGLLRGVSAVPAEAGSTGEAGSLCSSPSLLCASAAALDIAIDSFARPKTRPG